MTKTSLLGLHQMAFQPQPARQKGLESLVANVIKRIPSQAE